MAMPRVEGVILYGMLNDIFVLVGSWFPSFIGIRFSIRYNSTGNSQILGFG